MFDQNDEIRRPDGEYSSAKALNPDPPAALVEINSTRSPMAALNVHVSTSPLAPIVP